MRYGALTETETPCRPSGAAARLQGFVAEPGVAELLCDPIARALMAADKTDRQTVFALLESVSRRRAA